MAGFSMADSGFLPDNHGMTSQKDYRNGIDDFQKSLFSNLWGEK